MIEVKHLFVFFSTESHILMQRGKCMTDRTNVRIHYISYHKKASACNLNGRTCTFHQTRLTYQLAPYQLSSESVG